MQKYDRVPNCFMKLYQKLPDLSTKILLVVCEVPEARLSIDKTTDSDEVYFNTKACLYIYATSR